MNHLTVSDLCVGYRRADGSWFEAVRQASFALEAGLSLGIVGESGSGKSTLGRALLGYCRAGGRITRGSVSLAGRPVVPPAAGQSGFRWSGAAYVPQNPLSSLTPHMRVGAQVLEAVRAHRRCSHAQARRIALELFEATRLPTPEALLERYPHQLSGGQRQRVVIAAALAARPRLLVLDEPTTALDKTTEAQVLELVESLRERLRTTLVYVSHDLHVIARMCERVLVMRHGEIVEQGETARVYRQPVHVYTRQLLDAMPRVVAGGPRAAPVSEPGDGGEPLLHAQGLSFSYAPARRAWRFRRRPEPAGRPTLDGISFSIGRGRTLGVVGESGSGKSTLAALVSGLLAPQAGSIRFDGAPLPAALAARDLQTRRRIQVVFQDPLSSLNPRHRVADLLMRPAQVFFKLGRTQALAEARQWLDRLQLEPALLEAYPRQLSGGQQQRVAIARAFLGRPDLIVCDEITSALDASVQAQVLGELRELQRSTGTALLFISHDLGVIQQMAHTVMVLQRGEVRAHGPLHEIFDNPRDDYTRLLIQASSLAPLPARVSAARAA